MFTAVFVSVIVLAVISLAALVLGLYAVIEGKKVKAFTNHMMHLQFLLLLQSGIIPEDNVITIGGKKKKAKEGDKDEAATKDEAAG
jgi:hypothetical protein